MNGKTLLAEAIEMKDEIVENRRAIHRAPEVGAHLPQTVQFVEEKLRLLGYEPRELGGGVVAELTGEDMGRCILLRADMDALKVREKTDLPFRSENGSMHACGHDMHAAMLLGAAKLLMNHRDLLRGAVRLLFQPAEETDGGALPMVRAGAMEGVCAVYGLHVQPYLNVGQIDTRLGTLNAATNEVRLTVHGRSSHAAHPDEAVDAAVCAAQLLTALQTAVSRSASPLKPCVLTFGEIHGGTACNVICDEVKLNGTLRTVDPELRTLMKRRIREISAGIAAAFGATVDVEITDGYSALINNPAEAARALRLAGELLGRENAMLRADPSMGGEDFSFFAEQAPAAFFHLGCASQQPAAPLHSAGFTVDERCLPIGSVMHCALVFDKLNEEAES